MQNNTLLEQVVTQSNPYRLIIRGNKFAHLYRTQDDIEYVVFWDNVIVTRNENNKMEQGEYNDAGHFLAFQYELNCEGEIPYWKDEFVYTKEIELKVNAVNAWLSNHENEYKESDVWVTNWKHDYETYINKEMFDSADRFVQFVRLRWAKLYEIAINKTNPRAFKRFRDFALVPLDNDNFTPHPLNK